MSLISRVEISNYLTEGLDANHFAEWNPMLTGITLRMDGQSSLVNITNGGGKTSMAELLLFVLSRDRTLLSRVRDKAAPKGRGYTHARIEFRDSSGESFREPGLLEIDVNNLPGRTNVIGVALNNDVNDAPIFYGYSGTLEDSPCYIKTTDNLVPVGDVEFSKRTRSMPSVKWDTFRNIREWQEYVGLFMSMDVVRRNATYQAKGSDDKNASFFNFKPRNGESYDSAFFKAVIAPDLLTNLLNSFAEENESSIEDTLHLSLSQIVHSEREIARKQANLEVRQNAIENDLKPVVDAGAKANGLHKEVQAILRAVKKDVALLHHFGSQHSANAVVGLPRRLSTLPKAVDQDSRIHQALKGMVIARDDGILIRDNTISELAGVEVAVISKAADRKQITRTTLNSQVIDFACLFENHTSGAIKGGHYRKGYTRQSVEQLLPLLANTQGAKLDGLEDVFAAAFNIAQSQVDTNPASLRIYALEATLQANEGALISLQKEADRLTSAIDGMEKQVKGREENEAAWQAFSQIALHLPEELRSSPKQARDWVVDESTKLQGQLAEMYRRNGELAKGWAEYCESVEAAGLEGIDGIRSQHASLDTKSKKIHNNLRKYRQSVKELTDASPGLERALGKAQALLMECQNALVRMEELKESLAVFHSYFGEVDPTTVENPVTTVQKAARNNAQAVESLRSTNTDWERLTSLKAGSARFSELFGVETDPFKCEPLEDHRRWTEKVHLTQQGMQPLESLVLALGSFEVKFPGIVPAQWLRDADQRRMDLETDQRETRSQLIQTEKEIEALDALSLVDDAAFAKAWPIMGSSPERLYSMVQALPIPLEARTAALSALSGLLSAPVFESLEELERASALLESHGIAIPLLLKSGLLESIQSQSGAHGELRMLGFIAGRHSRKVRILLDPEYAQSERAVLVQRAQDLGARLEVIEADLGKVDFRGSDYLLAHEADKAIKNDSAKKYKALEDDLHEASKALERLAPQIQKEALDCLRNRREYVQKGGDERTAILWEQLEGLRSEVQTTAAALTEAQRRASPESVSAYFNACKYVKAGADVAHEAAKSSVDKAVNGVTAADHFLGLNRSAVRNAQGDLDSAIKEEDEFNEYGGELQLVAMKRVLNFADETEAVEFMRGFEKNCQSKKADALRLTGIQSSVNFDRADAYVANLGKSEIDLVNSISAMKTSLNEVNDKVTSLRDHNKVVREYEMPNWHSLRKSIHDLAYEVGSQASKTAKAFEELRALEEGMPPVEAHELYGSLAGINRSLVEATVESTSMLAAALEEQTFKLQDINPETALASFATQQSAFKSAFAAYEDINKKFCERSRQGLNTKQAAFNELELQKIEQAKPEHIVVLLEVFERLVQSLEKDRDDAQKAIQAAHNANEEAMTQLSRLIQVADDNLDALKKVMGRYPAGCFKVKVQLAGEGLIKEILSELKDRVGAVATASNETGRALRRSDESKIKEVLRETLIDKIFLEPGVSFVHSGIRTKESPVTDKLSTGQKVALEFMWIVRQAEYEIERGLRNRSAKDAKRARQENRVIFVDGIFSTLSDRGIIREAFNGLGNLGGNFQIIGFLHSPTWTNDYGVFPVYHVGKKLTKNHGASSLVAFSEPGRNEGTLGFFTSMAQTHDATV